MHVCMHIFDMLPVIEDLYIYKIFRLFIRRKCVDTFFLSFIFFFPFRIMIIIDFYEVYLCLGSICKFPGMNGCFLYFELPYSV